MQKLAGIQKVSLWLQLCICSWRRRTPKKEARRIDVQNKTLHSVQRAILLLLWTSLPVHPRPNIFVSALQLTTLDPEHHLIEWHTCKRSWKTPSASSIDSCIHKTPLSTNSTTCTPPNLHGFQFFNPLLKTPLNQIQPWQFRRDTRKNKSKSCPDQIYSRSN